MMPTPPDRSPLAVMGNLMIEKFNLEELRKLCFELNLDYEELSGDTKTAKVISLIDYAKRRSLLKTLHQSISEARPLLILPDLKEVEADPGNGLERKDDDGVQSRPKLHHQPFLWWLDRENTVVQPTIFLWIAIVLLSLQLSHAFSLVGLDESLLLMPLVLLGQLLPILAGATVRYGYQEMAERYRLDWRDWLVVFQHKYLAVLIRGFGAWGVIWIVWLAIYWAGWLNQLTPGWRQLIWLANLGFMILAGVTGAYQGMRQNVRFWRTAPRRSDLIMLFMGLVMPLIFVIPSFSAWILTQVGGIGVLIMVVMAVMMATALENSNQ